jgi:hypothetical protein
MILSASLLKLSFCRKRETQFQMKKTPLVVSDLINCPILVEVFFSFLIYRLIQIRETMHSVKDQPD